MNPQGIHTRLGRAEVARAVSGLPRRRPGRSALSAAGGVPRGLVPSGSAFTASLCDPQYVWTAFVERNYPVIPGTCLHGDLHPWLEES